MNEYENPNEPNKSSEIPEEYKDLMHTIDAEDLANRTQLSFSQLKELAAQFLRQRLENKDLSDLGLPSAQPSFLEFLENNVTTDDWINGRKFALKVRLEPVLGSTHGIVLPMSMNGIFQELFSNEPAATSALLRTFAQIRYLKNDRWEMLTVPCVASSSVGNPSSADAVFCTQSLHDQVCGSSIQIIGIIVDPKSIDGDVLFRRYKD